MWNYTFKKPRKISRANYWKKKIKLGQFIPSRSLQSCMISEYSLFSYRMQLPPSSRVSSALCPDITVSQRHTGKWLIIKLIITYLLSVITAPIYSGSAGRAHLSDFGQPLTSMPCADEKCLPCPSSYSWCWLFEIPRELLSFAGFTTHPEAFLDWCYMLHHCTQPTRETVNF